MTLPSASITPEQIDAALRLIGLEFTPAECEMMCADLQKRLDPYAQLRAIPLANEVAPALLFHPAPLAAALTGSPPVDRVLQWSPAPAITRPDSEAKLAFLPVTALAHLLRTGQTTSQELTELYLARLQQYDPLLHCVVSLMPERALAQARRADEERRQGIDRGPLHGIPWGAKDLLAVRGTPTTWGAEPYQEQQFDQDATVVQRLDKAGAVLVAKLTTGALANGDVWFGGQTKNPWDLAEGSSGSSAGPGAATAAGLVGFAIGTETMGSILSPSARCGITGLRPTFGRVSRHGCMALSWSMDKIGPMSRSVEDCALVLNAIYGPDGRDATVADRPFAWPPQVDLRQIRIGYDPAAFEAERPGKAFDEQTLAQLQDLGAQVVPIALPEYPHEALMLILLAEAAAAFDELTRSNQDDLLKRQEPNAWPNIFRMARLIPAVEYIQANRIRTRLIEQMATIMATVDLLVQPYVWGPALALTNFTGHPALLLPNGCGENGRPINSVSFVGRLYDEATLLAVGKAYQAATKFHQAHPPGFD
jgi:Asp-tRNA(Asn)/Glu-tRNA(Gln) amidotransferase A subunit family amidase